MVFLLQSFLAGLAASGVLTSALRLITKAAFDHSSDGLRKGASRFNSCLSSLNLYNYYDHCCPHPLLVSDHLSCYTINYAVLFFAISTFFELLCVILYAFIFPKLPIVKYYRSKAASEGSKTVSADLAAGGIRTLPGTVLCSHVLFTHQCIPEIFLC